MNVCVIGWMKLVVQSAMNTQLEQKSGYKDQSIYHWSLCGDL